MTFYSFSLFDTARNWPTSCGNISRTINIWDTLQITCQLLCYEFNTWWISETRYCLFLKAFDILVYYDLVITFKVRNDCTTKQIMFSNYTVNTNKYTNDEEKNIKAFWATNRKRQAGKPENRRDSFAKDIFRYKIWNLCVWHKYT